MEMMNDPFDFHARPAGSSNVATDRGISSRGNERSVSNRSPRVSKRVDGGTNERGMVRRSSKGDSDRRVVQLDTTWANGGHYKGVAEIIQREHLGATVEFYLPDGTRKRLMIGPTELGDQ